MRRKYPQFTYEQANVGDSEFNAYNIETMNYPDQGNHLEKMRTGAYVNTVIGVKAPALTSGNLPTAGSGSDGPSGSIKKPVTQTLLQVFSEAETLNDAFPFPKIKEEYFDEKTNSYEDSCFARDEECNYRPRRIRIRRQYGYRYSRC